MDTRIGRSLFDLAVRLPTFVLRETALANNIAVLATYCESRGVSFAPHGKTTMAPAIFRRQTDAGAWAITVADPAQAQVAIDAGMARVLIANEVVDDAGLAWIAGFLDRKDAEIIVCVDSVAGVNRMQDGLSDRHRRLQVLIEMGVRGGRAGVRTADEARAVAQAVGAADALTLAGVSIYEGVIEDGTREECETAVRALTDVVRQTVISLGTSFASAEVDEIVVSGGGSVYFDVVTDELTVPWPTRLPVRVVLRSGAYVTHDHGLYDQTSPFGRRAGPESPRLLPAIEVWASVLSRPEAGLLIAGAGRRDLPADEGLPVVVRIRHTDGAIRAAEPGFTVSALNDQHAFVDMAGRASASVGDRIAFGISHPCTAFQLWREALVVDDDDRILDVYDLHF